MYLSDTKLAATCIVRMSQLGHYRLLCAFWTFAMCGYSCKCCVQWLWHLLASMIHHELSKKRSNSDVKTQCTYVPSLNSGHAGSLCESFLAWQSWNYSHLVDLSPWHMHSTAVHRAVRHVYAKSAWVQVHCAILIVIALPACTHDCCIIKEYTSHDSGILPTAH